MEKPNHDADEEMFTRAQMLRVKVQEPPSLKNACFKHFSQNTRFWFLVGANLGDKNMYQKLRKLSQ